jgi:hypothetical protein
MTDAGAGGWLGEVREGDYLTEHHVARQRFNALVASHMRPSSAQGGRAAVLAFVFCGLAPPVTVMPASGAPTCARSCSAGARRGRDRTNRSSTKSSPISHLSNACMDRPLGSVAPPPVPLIEAPGAAIGGKHPESGGLKAGFHEMGRARLKQAAANARTPSVACNINGVELSCSQSLVVVAAPSKMDVSVNVSGSFRYQNAVMTLCAPNEPLPHGDAVLDSNCRRTGRKNVPVCRS